VLCLCTEKFQPFRPCNGFGYLQRPSLNSRNSIATPTFDKHQPKKWMLTEERARLTDHEESPLKRTRKKLFTSSKKSQKKKTSGTKLVKRGLGFKKSKKRKKQPTLYDKARSRGSGKALFEAVLKKKTRL